MTERQVAIITGASSGIGEASARLLAKAGYQIVLAARRAERLQSLQQEIEADGGEALAVPTDVSVLASIENLVNTAQDAYGQIDLLLNNAGFGRFKWLEQLHPEKDIDRQIEVNLLGVIYASRAVLPYMIERRSGHIINMASMASYIATPTYSVYAASKFAVRGFSEALRREVGVWGIKVSVIYPGGVATEFAQHTQARRKTGITTPKLLQLSSEDVARAVLRVAKRPRRRVFLPWVMGLSVWLNTLFPGLNDRLIERTFTKPERGI